ncbi:hypothetical protein AB0G74_27830 [Streptomyces sp. NPDC020875]|uniref:hypothetical protein n=1 Tax=Streptomyces sp. NPDC020875 TaxID=3154898 RepID=UPI0033C01D1F
MTPPPYDHQRADDDAAGAAARGHPLPPRPLAGDREPPDLIMVPRPMLPVLVIVEEVSEPPVAALQGHRSP